MFKGSKGIWIILLAAVMAFSGAACGQSGDEVSSADNQAAAGGETSATAETAEQDEGSGQAAQAQTGEDYSDSYCRSSYMCFTGLSSALSSVYGEKDFDAKSFRSSVAAAIKKDAADEDKNTDTAAENQDSRDSWPDPSKPMIALTFDDGPYSPVTDRILAKLEEYGGHATFFIVGSRLDRYSSSAIRAVKDGCQIGNHTYGHRNLTKLSAADIKKQIHDTDVKTAYYCGVSTTLIRPVGGAAGSEALRAVAGKPLINWDLDTKDWKSRSAASVEARVLNNAGDGDIILMHDLYESTADACDYIIPQLVSRGYQLVTVSEMAEARGRTLEKGTLYNRIL